MPKADTASFVCELPLVLSPSDERVMAVRFDIARQAYNACLAETLRRLDLMRESKEYQATRKLPHGAKGSPAAKARAVAFRAVNQRFGFREYDLHAWAAEHIKHEWLGEHLDINAVQKLATRAFQAAQQYAFGKRGRPRFKGRSQLDSLEGRSNDAGIRWRGDHVEWWGLRLGAIIDPKDPVIAHGLQSHIKYVRLVRRKLNGTPRYYVQLVCEGVPYRKEKSTIGQGVMGLDIGLSTIAMVAPDAKVASLEVFCGELRSSQQAIRKLQRKTDRQRRLANPANYNDDGTVKKGVKTWHTSARQRQTEVKLADLHRQQAGYRKSLHGRIVNRLMRLGNVIKLEKVSYRSFQRNFGKSVNFRAPGMFVCELKRKAGNAGIQVDEFPTRPTRLSQVCHNCGTVESKPLSERWHLCDCGIVAQRDLYSAFLASCVEGGRLNADQAKELWSGVDALLQAALSRLEQPASGGQMPASFGLRASAGRSQSRSPVEAGGNTVEAQVGVPSVGFNGKGELERDRPVTRTPRL